MALLHSTYTCNGYKVCPEGIQPCKMKNGVIYWKRYKIQETLYIGQWRPSLLRSGHFGTSHSFPNRHQLPHRIFLNSATVWNLSLSKVTLVLGKARSRRVPRLGCRGAKSSGWLMLGKKETAQVVMHEQAHVVMNLPITSCHSCSLLNHPNSFRGGMFKLNANSDEDLLFCSQSLWIWGPHSTHAHSTASTAPTD